MNWQRAAKYQNWVPYGGVTAHERALNDRVANIRKLDKLMWPEGKIGQPLPIRVTRQDDKS